MVYIDSNDIRWHPYVKTWSRKFDEKFGPLYTEYLLGLYNTYIDKGLVFVKKSCKEVIKQVRRETDRSIPMPMIVPRSISPK